MRDDALLGLLIGCGCVAACCCRDAPRAPTPQGGNLFMQASAPKAPPQLVEDTPLIAPSRYDRDLRTTLPDHLPSYGFGLGFAVARAEYTTGWGLNRTDIPGSLSDLIGVLYPADTKMLRTGPQTFAVLSAGVRDTNFTLYSWNYVTRSLIQVAEILGRAPEILNPSPGRQTATLGGANFVSVQEGGFTGYQLVTRSESYPAPTENDRSRNTLEVALDTLSISTGGDVTRSTGPFTLVYDSDVDEPIVQGPPYVVAEGDNSVQHITHLGVDLTSPPGAGSINLVFSDGSVLPHKTATDVYERPVGAVVGGVSVEPEPYSLTATVTARERWRGGSTLITLNALPVGLLADWPVRVAGSLRTPGVFPHARALLFQDGDRTVFDALPPGAGVTWAAADVNLRHAGDGVNLQGYITRPAQEPPDNFPLGYALPLGRAIIRAPAPLTGAEVYATDVTVDSGTLSPAPLTPPTVPALTRVLTPQFTWSVPAGTSSLTATFSPDTDPSARAARASVALRAPWSTPGLDIDPVFTAGTPPPSARTWIQRSVDIDPSAGTYTLRVTTPRPLVIQVGQLSVLYTRQASPL